MADGHANLQNVWFKKLINCETMGHKLMKVENIRVLKYLQRHTLLALPKTVVPTIKTRHFENKTLQYPIVILLSLNA